MRRFLIRVWLPTVFCLVPVVTATLVALATPPAAHKFYLMRIRESYMDWLILGLGTCLFVAQIVLSWRALRWHAGGFDEGTNWWIATCAQAAEWFPMLGLIGTVGGILQTFSQVTGQMPPEQIIRLYAPAITATGSGLFMALINILPVWVVNIGRRLISGMIDVPAPAPPE
jgi:hypothetical protein